MKKKQTNGIAGTKDGMPHSTNTHGGARPGSGRKAKEPTKTISNRVPEKHYASLKIEVKKTIVEYLKNNNAPYGNP